MNRRHRWLVRPGLYLLYRQIRRRGFAPKTDRQLAVEWWLWRMAGDRMPWHRGAP